VSCTAMSIEYETGPVTYEARGKVEYRDGHPDWRILVAVRHSMKEAVNDCVVWNEAVTRAVKRGGKQK